MVNLMLGKQMLQQEIDLMTEILTNLKQEQYSIVILVQNNQIKISKADLNLKLDLCNNPQI